MKTYTKYISCNCEHAVCMFDDNSGTYVFCQYDDAVEVFDDFDFDATIPEHAAYLRFLQAAVVGSVFRWSNTGAVETIVK